MTLQSCLALTTATLLMLILVGCKPSTVASGRVTYEGQAVRKGSILFQPADGHGASCGGPIIDGRYRLEVTPGKKTVEILGVKTVRYDRNDGAGWVGQRMPPSAAIRAERMIAWTELSRLPRATIRRSW